jgi:PAS domain S-box-containing protein
MTNPSHQSHARLLRIKAEELLKVMHELDFQNQEKSKRAEELEIANKELALQNVEKAKRADELNDAISDILKLTHELEVHQMELEMQNEELRQAESALRQLEAKHSSMISNISDVIGIIDVDGFMKYKSPNIEKWFGWKPDDLIGTDGWLTVHPDDIVRIKKEFYTLLETENSVTTVEYQYKCKNGSYKPIELTATNLAHDPVIGGVLLNYHDISRRRKVEEELKLESTRFFLAASAGGVGIWDYDVVNNILLWDDRMSTLYGINKNDFGGDYEVWQNLVHPDDKERVDHEFRLAVNRGTPFDTEFRVIWPDGSVHNIRAIAVVYGNNTGNSLRMVGTNWDITELRKSEKAKLEDSESKYRSIFQGSPEGIMITDELSKMVVFANSAQCEMLGYSQEELQTMNIAAIHLNETFQETLAVFDRRSSSEKIFAESIQCLKKNGEIFYADIASSSITINGRRCQMGFFRDVTLRRQSEATLRKSEELLSTVVSNSSELTTLTDTDGHIIFISPQSESVLGYTSDNFIGIQIPDIIHPDDVEMVKLAWEGIFHEAHELREFQYRIIDEQGAVRWLLHSAKIVTINGIAIGVLSTIRNITDRKIAEEVIKASEEKYRTMLNASPDGMLLIDMAGIIAEVSEIGLHLFGADTRDDLVGNDILQFVPPEENNRLKETFSRATHEGLAQNIGLNIRRKDQTVFAGEISATLMQDQNRVPISFMVIVRDISQRKKMEAKQIHTDRMSTLGEMAAGIAHEINQPLNIISLVADRVLFELDINEMVDIGFIKMKMEKVSDNVIRIRDIIDHVRAFSRSHENYILSAFNVNSSVINATSMVLEQFKHHGIILNLELGQQIPQIVGNTYKFEQVILNLLVNAKDALTEKKRNQPEEFEMLVGIRSFEQNQCIIVEISDNGIGINKHEIPNIMLPFYTTKEEGKGTGLGLSISYQIIKEMNGTIEITSDSSSGTKVKLVLHVQKTK